jgi:WD40 repeat protein
MTDKKGPAEVADTFTGAAAPAATLAERALWADLAVEVMALLPLTGHTDQVGAVAFSPDGSLLATGSYDSTVRLWDPVSRKPAGDPLSGHTGSVVAVAFSPDGSLLATGSYDSTVRLWTVPPGGLWA